MICFYFGSWFVIWPCLESLLLHCFLMVSNSMLSQWLFLPSNICCKVLLGKRQCNQERWRFSSHFRVDWRTFLYWHRNTNWLSFNISVHLLVAECWGSSNKNRNKVIVWNSWTEQACENTFQSHCFICMCLLLWHLRWKIQFWSPHWLQTSASSSPLLPWFWLMMFLFYNLQQIILL